MAITDITLILDLYDGRGQPITLGSAVFTPNVPLTDVTDQMIVTQQPVTAAFEPGAFPSVQLLPTDNPNLLPADWEWQVTFHVQGGLSSYDFPLPAGPVNITATHATPAVFTYTPVSGGLQSLQDGTGVQLAGGSLPAGFSPAVTYFVVGASGETIELAATPGGSPIASTSTGSGTLQVVQYALSALQTAESVAPPAYQLMQEPAGTATAGQVPVATGIGDETEWGDAGGGGGDVASVFGRTGTVTAQSGDYTAAQVGADASGAAATAQTNAETYAAAQAAAAQSAAEAASLPELAANVTVSANATLALDTVTEAVATSGNLTMTLPTATAGALIVCEKADSSANTVTISGLIRGASSTLVLKLQYESEMLLGYAGSWWPIAGHKTLASLQALFLQAANNLSDLASAATARTNLGVVASSGGGLEVISALGNITGSTTINLANGNVFTGTQTGNITLAFSGATAAVACTVEIWLTQDATGGRTVTLPGSAAWLGGTTPTLNAAPSAVNILIAETLNGGTSWTVSLAAPQPAYPLASALGGLGLSSPPANELLAGNGSSPAQSIASSGTVGNFLLDEGSSAAPAYGQPPLIAPTGLTGATAASRYVGATTSGAPASGTFAKGDFVIDQTAAVWVCTTAGTIGSGCVFTQAGGSSAVQVSRLPSDDGLLAESWDPEINTTSATPVNGTLYLARIIPRVAMTATDICFDVATVASAATSTGSFVGLYSLGSNQLTKLSGSSDMGATLNAALSGNSNQVACPLTTAQAMAVGTTYYAALLVNMTSGPSLYVPTTSKGLALVASGTVWQRSLAVDAEGTSLPTTITAATITGINQGFYDTPHWMAVK